jgi:hypothetical protein
MFAALTAAYPEVPPPTLAHFAANVVDYRDVDSEPTSLILEETQEIILGTEIVPFIVEVWPDSTTQVQDGDDGQFIEIFNPFDVPLSLAGWSLRIVGGPAVALNGTLVPGGFLIVTDDYNEEHDPTPEDDISDYGSFYDIFHAVPNGRNRILIEQTALEIPDSGGIIELRDAAGSLVDVFMYGGGAAGGLKRSYQRTDPRLRITQVARCTPYRLLPPGEPGDSPLAAGLLLASTDIRNGPFTTALELFAIGGASMPSTAEAAPRWRRPAIGPDQPGFLDERLVDLFTVWTDRVPVVADTVAALQTASISSPTTVAAVPAMIAPAPASECGRININAAPAPVLRALPGITETQIEHLLYGRQALGLAAPGRGALAYACLSELLADDVFWANAPDEARLRRTAQWINTITCTTNAYRIISENRPEPVQGPRIASRSKVEALVSTDGGQNQVVVWRFVE